MIEFYYETEFRLTDSDKYTEWLDRVIQSEGKKAGPISYSFCSDEKLLKLNQQYLNHDYFTDILSFDYTENDMVSGEIYISIDRIAENADEYNVSKEEELRRVMVHGILHFLGYMDKSAAQKKFMRQKEQDKINMFHVEQ